jgi:ABC-2 type transport system ATP-binding protein
VFVETHLLSKRYGDFAALDECTLGVQEGEVFGLLGPNGAGKTTLIRLLLGYLSATSGSATIDGLDCRTHSVAVRQRTAYLPGEARLFRAVRGRDVLRFFAEIRAGGSVERSFQLADRLELDLSRFVAFMSTGMRQKLALAVTLAADVPLLILDEPTTNLDPTVRAAVIEMVAEAREAGRTVLFSSHVLSEVEEVCDRVAILRRGRLVHTQVMGELRRRHRVRATLREVLPPVPEEIAGGVRVLQLSSTSVEIEAEELSPLLGWLAALPVEEVRIEPIGLRGVYDRFHRDTGNAA